MFYAVSLNIPFDAWPYFIAAHVLKIHYQVHLQLSLFTAVSCREVSVSIASTTVKQHQLSLSQAKVSSSF
jgi:hypothetical protein